LISTLAKTHRRAFVSLQIRRQKSLNLAPGALLLERPIVDFGEYDIPLFIRGEPAGERTVPVVVRERL
jgi:hypothetical protein